MAKKTQSVKVGAGVKVALLLVLFGLPILFVLSSWGLEKIYDIAPLAIVLVIEVFATAYTAYTSGLLYNFYNLKAPAMRFLPCVGEVSLIDIKYHVPCYILYAVAVVFLGVSQLPYSVVGILGRDAATTIPFIAMAVGLVCLFVIQIIKGIGIMGCIKDIAVEWKKQVHVDQGAITKFAFLAFIPFVRVLAVYALNKPLSTMVTFMESTVDSGDEDSGFEEEADEEEFAED